MNPHNNNIQVARRDLLEALATQAPRPTPTKAGSNGTVNGRPSGNGEYQHRLLVENWLRDRGIESRIKKQADGKGRTVYVLKQCPFDPDHGDPDSCIMQGPDGAMSAQCFHNSCSGRGWQQFKEEIGKPESHHYDPPLSASPTSTRANGPARSAPSKPNHQAESTNKQFTVGPLIFRPGTARQTASGRLSMPIDVMRDGTIVYPFVLTNAASSRREPLRVLKQLYGDDSVAGQLDTVLTQMLAYAAEKVAQRQRSEGPTIRQIVADKVPPALHLVCRMARNGAWSESRGGEMSRSDFVTFIPGWLVDECGQAADAPRDDKGLPVRWDLIRVIQMELAVLWSDLHSALPAESDVDLGENTEKGRAFRQALIRLWKLPITWEKQQTASGDTATRASLVSRVLSQRERHAGGQQGRAKWLSIHPASDAWWRDWQNPDGEIETLLAMRYTLTAQVGIDLPGVVDESSLTRLGNQFRVLREPPEGVPSRLSGGTHRLAILSASLTSELLEMPDEDLEDNQRDPGA